MDATGYWLRVHAFDQTDAVTVFGQSFLIPPSIAQSLRGAFDIATNDRSADRFATGGMTRTAWHWDGVQYGVIEAGA